MRPSDEIFGRHQPDPLAVSRIATVGAAIAIVTHQQQLAFRYHLGFGIVAFLVGFDIERQIAFPFGQSLTILRISALGAATLCGLLILRLPAGEFSAFQYRCIVHALRHGGYEIDHADFFHRLAVNFENARPHLDDVARQPDHPFNIVDIGVT